MALDVLDVARAERLATLAAHLVYHRLERRRGVPPELPQLLTARALEVPGPLLDLELEGVRQQLFHVVAPAPLERRLALRRPRLEPVVQIAELGIGLPGGEAHPVLAYPGELAGGRLVVGREDQSERGADDIEGCIVVLERSGIAELEADLGRLGAGDLQHPRRDVDANDVRPGGRSPHGDRSGAGREVEPALTR